MTKRLSLRARLRRVIIITGISFYLFTSFIVAAVEIKRKKNDYASAMITTVSTFEAIIIDYINQYHEYIQHVIAKMPDGAEPVVINYFKENLHFQNLRDMYYMLDSRNHITHIPEPYEQCQGLDLSHIEHISKNIPVSKVHQSLFSQQPVVSFLYPLAGNRMLVLEKDLKGIVPLAEHFNLGEIFGGGYLFILSANGTVVYHPDKQIIDSRHNLGFELTDWSEPDARGLQTFTYHEKKYLCYRITLEKPIGWTLYFVVPNIVLFRAITYHVAQIFLIFAAVFSFLIFFLQLIMNKKLSKPVSEIVTSISTCNLDGTDEPIPQSKASGTKELTSIIDAINNMMAELNRSNEGLRESEQRNRTLVETMNDVVFTLDTNGRFTLVNPQFEKLTGYNAQDFIGHSFSEILAPEYRESTGDLFRRGLSGESTPIYEVEVIYKDGKRVPIELNVTSLLDAHGNPVGRIGVARDISERKHAEDALRENEERLTTIMDSIQAGIVIIDAEKHTIVDANPAAIKMIGDPKEKIIGHVCHKYICQSEKGACPITDLGKKMDNSEHVMVKANGEEVTIIKTVTPILLSGKKCLLDTFIDISDKKKLQTQLQRAQKMEAIGILAGGVAHDFNNLLMGIQGRISLMMIDKDSFHPDFEHLKGIEDYVKNAADLTKQLLGFARSGKYEVKPTDINKFIEKTSRMFGRTKKEIKIYRKYQKDIWTVEVDQGQIDQVLMNLYVNAWQAMPGGGYLYLETENVNLDEDYVKPFEMEPGKYVKISVTDTGIGMDKETQHKIFDPFFTTKKMGRGTGLGLASVYGIIKNHDGFISLYSKKGGGTTFKIYLPASEKKVMRGKELPQGISKGSETILLVDDEEMVIDVGEQLLEKMGYTVLIARSGKKAIEIYDKNKDRIDIIILDLIMPDMSGSDTFDGLKEINPSIKVLLSSGYSINGKATEILDRGGNSFIQKPFGMKDLSQKIREILDNK